MECRIALLGSGSIASQHAYAVAAQRFYYEHSSYAKIVCVASPNRENRERFAERFDIPEAISPEDVWQRRDINAVIIASPNRCHYEHLERLASMRSVERVYVEKPLCCSSFELQQLRTMARGPLAEKTVLVGFQFLQYAAIRRAFQRVHAGEFGTPIHFHASYLHSGYLDASYRRNRVERLVAAPVGGALADLGSHAISLLVAFLGKELSVVAARRSGTFADVPTNSDLCANLLLSDKKSGAVGTLTASRVSAGASDSLSLEIRFEEGAIRFSAEDPNVFWSATSNSPSKWTAERCGSEFLPNSTFPAITASAGFLRPLVHAHSLFLSQVRPVGLPIVRALSSAPRLSSCRGP